MLNTHIGATGCGECVRLWNEFSSVNHEYFDLHNRLDVARFGRDHEVVRVLQPLVSDSERRRSQLREEITEHEGSTSCKRSRKRINENTLTEPNGSGPGSLEGRVEVTYGHDCSEMKTPLYPRILVVDDERTILRLTKSLLELKGYQVLTALDAEEGLEDLQGTGWRPGVTRIRYQYAGDERKGTGQMRGRASKSGSCLHILRTVRCSKG